jgi:membrane protein required for colicin V production
MRYVVRSLGDVLTVVDVLVLGTLGIGLILGMVRGFLAQFTGLAGLVGGLLLAERYYPGLRRAALDPWLQTEHNGAIAFVGIVVFTVLVAAVFGWLLALAIGRLQLGAYDRLMGAAFGLLKSGLICAAVLLAVVYFSPDGGNIERHIGSSKAAPMLWRAMTRVAGALPERYRGDVRGFLEENQPLRSETAKGE